MGTYTWGDVLSMISFTNRAYAQDFSPVLADRAQSALWHANDWHETLGVLPPFFLVPFEQDYGSPVTIVPADFEGLRKADLVCTYNNPSVHLPLNILRYPNLTEMTGCPTELGYDQYAHKFRVWPRVPANFGAPQYLIEATYKKGSTKLTPTTWAAATVPWDDLHIETVIAVAKLCYYDLVGDQQKFANQFPITQHYIDSMSADEALNSGDQTIAPTGTLQLGFGGITLF